MTSLSLHIRRLTDGASWRSLLPAVILIAALLLGFNASPTVLILLFGAITTTILLQKQLLSLVAIIVAALFIPLELGTGTAVPINPVTLAVPGLVLMWILRTMRIGQIAIRTSRLNRPLIYFILFSFTALVIGNAIWSPSVPRPDSFFIVQLGQVAIFALSVAALVLAANIVQDTKSLQTLTFIFLLLSGVAAALYILPPFNHVASSYLTAVFDRAPFWLLLFSLAAGQLLFNPELTTRWRLFCITVVGLVLFHSIYNQVVAQERSVLSGLIGVSVAIVVFLWLKIPRFRLLSFLLIAVLAIVAGLFPATYEFVGGDDEWFRSGGARIALITRTVEVTMYNPITGLGPAAYRHYSAVEPLQYAHITWVNPRVSSHNNYVDIFAHTGIIGLGLFLWFMAELGWLCFRLHRRFRGSFEAGYVNSMFAIWAGIAVIMLVADWFLPFVYNVSFRGFQASVLVWVFFGGLVVLENLPQLKNGRVEKMSDSEPSAL